MFWSTLDVDKTVYIDIVQDQIYNEHIAAARQYIAMCETWFVFVVILQKPFETDEFNRFYKG